jgi:hypothetical protein
MQPAEAGLSLVMWQGWGVLSVMAALTALLATVLAWLLPFPDRSLNSQLSHYDDRMALKDRLGAAPPFKAYLVTVCRFNRWLTEWFGPALNADRERHQRLPNHDLASRAFCCRVSDYRVRHRCRIQEFAPAD